MYNDLEPQYIVPGEYKYGPNNIHENFKLQSFGACSGKDFNIVSEQSRFKSGSNITGHET